MASPPSQQGHLVATGDREVVYCHACSNEWYKDEHGLECPACQSDITEIITAENDPREYSNDLSDSPSPDLPPFHLRDGDSDPDEADIEEHVGPHGFLHHRSTRTGHDPTHHNPGVDPVIERFFDMIQNFGPVRQPGGPRGPSGPGSPGLEGGQPPQGGEPHAHRAVFTSTRFGNGTASVTIFSGPVQHNDSGQTPGSRQAQDPFQSIFSSVLRDIGPPQSDQNGRPVQGFTRGLVDMLNMFNPANAISGDVVYTQEALDRIITNMMEAHPQSNAAPPATEEGLAKLERQPVTEEMLKGEAKAECSICIDDMQVGETATFLPCKHWFHDACVVLWLKEHNTCPVCRAPIERNSSRGNSHTSTDSVTNNNSNNLQPSSASSDESSRQTLNIPSANLAFQSPAPSSRERSRPGNDEQTTGVTTGYSPRPPNQSQTRLNEALRNISSLQVDRGRDDPPGSTPDFTYDTSRFQRRSSHSPTSPRITQPGVYGAQMRQRSPSESSRRTGGERESQRQPNAGPISWLRDRFSGSGPGRGASGEHD